MAKYAWQSQVHFSPDSAPRPHKLVTSPKFALAWLALLKGLLLAATPTIPLKRSQRFLKRCDSLLRYSCKQVSRHSRSVGRRRELEIVQPIGLFALLAERLMEDVTKRDKDYVLKKYREEIYRLVRAFNSGLRSNCIDVNLCYRIESLVGMAIGNMIKSCLVLNWRLKP
jgi:hypothetical protein